MPNRHSPALLFVLSVCSALSGQGHLEGDVKQVSGIAVGTALVALNRISPPPAPGDATATLFARTDAKGHFVFADVPTGQYGATVTATGLQAGFWGNLSAGPDGKWKDMAFTLVKGGTDVQVTFRSNLKFDHPLKVYAGRISQDAGDVFYPSTVTSSGFDICLSPGDYMLVAEGDPYTGGMVNLHVGNEPSQKVALRVDRRNPPVTPEIEAWLKEHAKPFSLTDAGPEAMKPFDKVIGNARLVAFGEFAHGSHEFFEVGQRMLKFLVEKRGFKVLCIEAPFTEALAVNRYVVDGEGTPEQALNKLGFFIWNNEEMLSTIQWMRAYNQGKPLNERVRFYGFDPLSGPASAKALLDYLSAHDQALFKWAEPRLTAAAKAPATASVYDEHLKQFCAELKDRLQMDRAALVSASSAEAFETACQQAMILSQHCDGFLEKGLTYGSRSRDLAMAENIRWIYNHRGKAVIWAHKGHVTDIDTRDAEGTPSAPYANDSMGHHLRGMFGDKLILIGSDCFDGEFNAIGLPDNLNLGLTRFQFPPAPPNDFSAAMSKVPGAAFLLDVREAIHASSPGMSDWIRAFHLTHNVGSEFDPQAWPAFAPERVGDQYDAIMYTRHATGLHPAIAAHTDLRPASEFKSASPTNLGFETWNADGNPVGWFLSASGGYQIAPSSEDPHEGKSSVMLSSTRKGQDPAGALMQTIDARAFQGKTITVTGWVRTHLDPSMGGASVSVIVTGPRENLSLPGMTKGRIFMQDWSEQKLVFSVPVDAVSFTLVLGMRGAGEVRFDDFALQVAP